MYKRSDENFDSYEIEKKYSELKTALFSLCREVDDTFK